MDWGKLLEVFQVVLFTSAGQLLLRLGMRGFEANASGLDQLIRYVLHTPSVWFAVGLYGVSTLLWMRVLTRYPVGAVYPMVAMGYVLVTIGGLLFLNEKVPLQGWLALMVICFGTLLLAATPWQSAA
jgi:multidrug transporter EmrE-like cation transporter